MHVKQRIVATSRHPFATSVINSQNRHCCPLMTISLIIKCSNHETREAHRDITANKNKHLLLEQSQGSMFQLLCVSRWEGDESSLSGESVWCLTAEGRLFYGVLGTTGPGAKCAWDAARRRAVDDGKEADAHDFMVNHQEREQRGSQDGEENIRPPDPIIPPEDTKPRNNSCVYTEENIILCGGIGCRSQKLQSYKSSSTDCFIFRYMDTLNATCVSHYNIIFDLFTCVVSSELLSLGSYMGEI